MTDEQINDFIKGDVIKEVKVMTLIHCHNAIGYVLNFKFTAMTIEDVKRNIKNNHDMTIFIDEYNFRYTTSCYGDSVALYHFDRYINII